MEHKHKQKKLAGALVLLAVIALGSFYGGIAYEKRAAAATRAGGFTGGQGARGARGMNGGFITGDIVSTETGSITVKTRDGSTKIVLIPGSALVLKSTTGTTTDLKIGNSVTVTGAGNTDGSLNAQTIQIRPQGMSPMGPGRN